MHRHFFKKFRRKLNLSKPINRKYQDINPEDIFLDSTNLPGFDEHALEGRIERPMSHTTFFVLKIVFALLIIALGSKLWLLGVKDGEVYAQISDNNRLEQTLIFANRGAILDRNGIELATNEIKEDDGDFPGRLYAPMDGLAHAVGYLKYPLKDRSGVYYEIEYRAKGGVETAYDDVLKGKNGLKLIETDVLGNVTSESTIEKPVDGESLTTSLDAKVTEVLYDAMSELVGRQGFRGGVGVIINVETGEILALTSYPEYDQNLMTKGIDQKTFDSLINSPGKPFLNRAIGGLYTPGSILKPVVALAALNEGIISPEKEILSTGSISVPNPYDPTKPSIFGDWKVHGWTAMREALAVSSDTYFYSVGGGFDGQKGLGIGLLDRYFKLFAIEDLTGIELPGEVRGLIPTPEWKAEKFDGDIWRLGDTFITAIGQYGTQMTPLSAARMTAAIANKGKVLKPSLLLGGSSEPIIDSLEFKEKDWKVIHEGMRGGVTYGTSVGLNVPYVEAAAKTGTAEVGTGKLYVNSWSVGFFPYKNPKYAWAVIMERGPSNNNIGATSIMRTLFDWMSINAPHYFK
ncbi:MAG: penicillin-binding transpeptidase domain-containing protein [Candidatus Zambryskibacteria bacterium]|nr:penicillin-binding transpeptidase domain-containing protein [Candidatus Zambryskibacteria bacterium]